MSTSLKSGYNSSYQAKTEASDIIQSRRTSGEVRETPHVSKDLIYYLLLQSKDKGNEDDYPVTGKNR